MVSLLILALTLAETIEELTPGCETDAPVRDPAICEPLYDDGGEYKIYNIESVAVGSVEEMKQVRKMTKHCNVDNRIDHFGGVDVAVYDIINADQTSRACVTGSISESLPELVYSKQRLQQKFSDAPLLKESDLP